MKLTGEEARNIVWGEDEDWDEVEDHVVDNSRWSIFHEGIFKHTLTGRHYEFFWSVGATESQDERPFEGEDEVKPVEVAQREVLVKQWVPLLNKQ